MASFDFVECSSKAYRFVWEERAEILRLSAMVLAIKIVSFVALIVFGLESNVLRQGLVLIPAYFIEGCVVVRVIVMAVYAQEEKSSAQHAAIAPEKMQQNLQAAAIVYLLTKMAMSFLTGMGVEGQNAMPETPPPEPSMQMFAMAVILLLLMIWAFRFVWLYVPVALGYTPGYFVKQFKGFSSSFYMAGVWILCFVPLALVMILAAETLGMVLPQGEGEKSMSMKIGLAGIQAVIDYGMALISSVGVAYGVYSVFKNENKKTPIW